MLFKVEQWSNISPCAINSSPNITNATSVYNLPRVLRCRVKIYSSHNAAMTFNPKSTLIMYVTIVMSY